MQRIVVVSPATLAKIEPMLEARDIAIGVADAAVDLMPIIENLVEMTAQGKAVLVLPFPE